MIRKLLNPEEFFHPKEDVSNMNSMFDSQNPPENPDDNDPGKGNPNPEDEDEDDEDDDPNKGKPNPDDNDPDKGKPNPDDDDPEKGKPNPTDDFDLLTDEERAALEDNSDSDTTPESAFNNAASELGITLPEGQEKWDQKSFIDSVKQQIEDSRQKLNLEEYDPEVQILFDYLQNNDGSLNALAQDDTISGLNQIGMLDPENFFRFIYAQDMKENNGWTDDMIAQNIQQTLDMYDDEGERAKFLKKFKNDKMQLAIQPAINERIKEINDEKSQYRQKLDGRRQQEFEDLKKNTIEKIDKIEHIAGIPMSENMRKLAKKSFSEDRNYESLKNDPEVLLMGYLMKTFGSRIADAYSDILTKREQSSYYEGIMRIFDRGHSKKPAGTDSGKRPKRNNGSPTDDSMRKPGMSLFDHEN